LTIAASLKVLVILLILSIVTMIYKLIRLSRLFSKIFHLFQAHTASCVSSAQKYKIMWFSRIIFFRHGVRNDRMRCPKGHDDRAVALAILFPCRKLGNVQPSRLCLLCPRDPSCEPPPGRSSCFPISEPGALSQQDERTDLPGFLNEGLRSNAGPLQNGSTRQEKA